MEFTVRSSDLCTAGGADTAHDCHRRFPAGSRLPSVRELAVEAAVNPNTMQRALARLEEDGLLYTQRTSGRYVTEETNRIMQAKEAMAGELIRQFIENMEKLGYTREQAMELIKRQKEEEECKV